MGAQQELGDVFASHRLSGLSHSVEDQHLAAFPTLGLLLLRLALGDRFGAVVAGPGLAGHSARVPIAQRRPELQASRHVVEAVPLRHDDGLLGHGGVVAQPLSGLGLRVVAGVVVDIPVIDGFTGFGVEVPVVLGEVDRPVRRLLLDVV